MGRETQNELKSLDLMVLCCVLGLAVLLPAVIVQGKLLDTKIYETEHLVEREVVRMAYSPQLLVPTPALVERGPASIGPASIDPVETPHLGRDAWGHELRSQVLADARGNAVEVAVWSAGPNATFETRVRRRPGAGAMRFEGDDIGYVFRLKDKSL